MLGKSHPKVAVLLDEARSDVRAFVEFSARQALARALVHQPDETGEGRD